MKLTLKNKSGFIKHHFFGIKNKRLDFSNTTFCPVGTKSGAGFTLVELLVVIAIIGLLANMAVVGLNRARQKSRDATRVSDMKNIKTALELYFNDNDEYPSNPTGTLGETGALTLSAGNGWADTTSGSIFMGQVPDDPDINDSYNYTYYQIDSGASYVINFGLESGTGDLECTTYSATCCSTSPTSTICN